MINRADAFWAWVWDGEEKPNKPNKELVIDSSEDGGWCITVSPSLSFYERKRYITANWDYYERIPEPKKRLMTREEILGFIAWNPHIVVRIHDEIPQQTRKYSYIRGDLESYEWASITEAGEIGEWSKFYKEVEEGD